MIVKYVHRGTMIIHFLFYLGAWKQIVIEIQLGTQYYSYTLLLDYNYDDNLISVKIVHFTRMFAVPIFSTSFIFVNHEVGPLIYFM